MRSEDFDLPYGSPKTEKVLQSQYLSHLKPKFFSYFRWTVQLYRITFSRF